MKNIVIFNKAIDGSWIAISGAENRRLEVDPSYKEIVNNWNLDDPVIVEASKNPRPYTMRIYNTIKEEYANFR